MMWRRSSSCGKPAKHFTESFTTFRTEELAPAVAIFLFLRQNPESFGFDCKFVNVAGLARQSSSAFLARVPPLRAYGVIVIDPEALSSDFPETGIG